MQRHMQNISFIAIVGVLLGCAFFFSQLTKMDGTDLKETDSQPEAKMSIADITECDAALTGEDAQECYQEAAQIADQLVQEKVDQILSLETESDHRIAFIEMQQAWEDSRDADCEFIRQQSDDNGQESGKAEACLLEQNLTRLTQLDEIYCEWYGDVDCDPSQISVP